jgi:hypothetical protein
MTNGENTAFIPIREYLESRGFPGYAGYQSDSEVFTHILHFAVTRMGLGIESYKHIITPLQDGDLRQHPNRHLLQNLKQTCRKLIIDGPNCVIGSLPDHSLFMVQDRKKLRPGVVGGRPGMLRVFLRALRAGRGHSGPGQTPGFSTHASRHRDRQCGSSGG